MTEQRTPWRSAPAADRIEGWCPHGHRPCLGAPDRGLEPCLASEHHYCPHGVDNHLATSDHQHRCPYCRGIQASTTNRGTYNPRTPRRTP